MERTFYSKSLSKIWKTRTNIVHLKVIGAILKIMSKKIILLAVFSAGLLFSCQKENIVPGKNRCIHNEEQVMRGSLSSSNVDAQTNSKSNGFTETEITRDESITDPNNDEDRNKKKKGNH